MKQLVQNLVIALFLLHTAAASAITIDGGPAWPGSADTSGFSGSGDLAGLSNDTWTYPNIGASPVANLWFGLGAGWGPHGYSANGGSVSGAELFSWFGDTLTSIEYRGATSTIHLDNSTTPWSTRLLLTAVSGASVVSDVVTQALADNVHSLFHITGTSFVVKRQVQVFDGGGWHDANPYLTTWCTGQVAGSGCAQTGTGTQVNTGFYWEDSAAVPEPTTLVLLGLGLAGLGFGARRKKLT